MKKMLVGCCAFALVSSVALAATPAPAPSAAPAATPAKPSATEAAAIFKAAGFKAKGSKYVRCEDDVSLSYAPGSIELEDVNGDGNAEAWVKESSTNCYGMTAEAFVLLTKNAKGAWVKLLDEVGIADPKPTKHNGWPDIEVGGPGMGPFPVYQYNGKKYVAKK